MSGNKPATRSWASESPFCHARCRALACFRRWVKFGAWVEVTVNLSSGGIREPTATRRSLLGAEGLGPSRGLDAFRLTRTRMLAQDENNEEFQGSGLYELYALMA